MGIPGSSVLPGTSAMRADLSGAGVVRAERGGSNDARLQWEPRHGRSGPLLGAGRRREPGPNLTSLLGVLVVRAGVRSGHAVMRGAGSGACGVAEVFQQ